MTHRFALPHCRNHATQRISIAGQRMLYLSVHDEEQLAEIFRRVKGPNCSSELVGLYGVIACLKSLAFQSRVPLEKGGELLAGANVPQGHIGLA